VRNLSASQYCNRKRSFEGDVEAIARAGLQGVGVAKEKLLATGVQRGARLLRDAGLGVASYSAGGWFLREREAGKQAVDRLCRAPGCWVSGYRDWAAGAGVMGGREQAIRRRLAPGAD
jgi:sugar phosphate isomerase/epimerase